jgi:hypothetical protein
MDGDAHAKGYQLHAYDLSYSERLVTMHSIIL